MADECGTDDICAPYTGAFAGLVKATLFFAEPDSAFQPYLSLSAGGGTIRHVSKVTGARLWAEGESCVDTVLAAQCCSGRASGFAIASPTGIGLVASRRADRRAQLHRRRRSEVGVAFRL